MSHWPFICRRDDHPAHYGRMCEATVLVSSPTGHGRGYDACRCTEDHGSDLDKEGGSSQGYR